MQSYHYNISIYPMYRFMINMLIIGPVLVPYMLLKGLDYTQIMLLQSISAVAVFLFEVPTGSIADKFSRKFSLFLSGLFIAICMWIYIVFNSFFMFAIAEIIFGIGFTFGSGADSALLYESLKKLGRTSEYQQREGSALSYVFIGQAIGSIASGFLFKINAVIPFWISFLNVLIAAVIALFFVETEREKSEHKYVTHVLKSAGLIFKIPRVFWAMFYAMLMGFALRVGYWIYQPYFSAIQLDIAYYGIVFFLFNLVAAFSSKVLVKRYKNVRPRKVLLALCLLMVISFIVPAMFLSKIALVIIALQQVVRGLHPSTLRFYINHQIEDKYRATVISFSSLLANLSFAILAPFVGWVLDNKGTIPAYYTVGLITLVGTVFLYQLRKFQKSKN
ncbi:MFS transporter [Thermosipho atlanticus]|uniref:Predicted arabinose efflux permease, MFS family n=1 Tax=Thermosipho atlanticus DSM 15807 TaxID=1123380 RepID=A0A1M5RQT8_9BACT|nr:MFS transporter [Thermosipho atlanticus]SHH28559.1 Predicted arabinose efflux permease, MFS family [Thermosipho atlanticus DSM 15807]